MTTPGESQTDATVVYCATGAAKYIREARQSARSLRNTNPNIRIALFTDAILEDQTPFDVVHRLENVRRSFADKIAVLRTAPYDRFVFLDGDTFVIGDISPLFALLDRFDFAAAHDLLRVNTPLPGLPLSFPELNTGVMGIRRSAMFSEFMERWEKLYLEHRAAFDRLPTEDQPSFRQLLWNSNLRFATLTPEWNCMFDAGQGISGHVFILHGRTPHIEYVARKINVARIHRQSLDLRNRWFKGEGRGFGWVRRSSRIAFNLIRLKMVRYGLLRESKTPD